ncbi:MAG: DMT family transporter [Acidobacteriaceae bacterium]|nr:DMT family transporter [Acidobacteriaceae bacterium]
MTAADRAAERTLTHSTKAELALAFVALLWGTTFVIVRGALPRISTMYFLSVRFTLATACMCLLFLPAFRSMSLRDLRCGLRGGFAAGVFLWLGYVLQTFGLKYTTAGNSGFLTGLYIVVAPLIGAAFARRWLQPAELGGLAVATAGLVLLAAPNVSAQYGVNRGDLLTIGCAIVFAFHLLVLGHFSKRERFEAVAIGQVALTAVLSSLSLIFEPPAATWTAGVVFAIVITGVFATAVAFAFQTWGQKYTTVTRTALIFALEPVFALVTAVAVGGEKLTIYSVTGGALILCGILLVELRPQRVDTQV